MSQLRLLGPPEFEHQLLNANKSLMLLTYLVCEGDWVGREKVAGLIWPETNASTRLTRLRQMLRFLEGQGWCPDLEIERSRLRWARGSDVHLLLELYQGGEWSRATQVYRGTLLEGVQLEAQEPYSQWLTGERVRLRGMWSDAAKRVASELEEQGRVTEALEVLERILREDALAEDALCEVLRICLVHGHIDRGLTAYAVFQQRLTADYSAQPQASTLAWLDRLHQSATPLPSESDGPLGVVSAQDPLPATFFVGRDRELTALVEWLNSEFTGLFTLCGPGGVGKTRLAIEATQRSSYPSVFVPLVSLHRGQSVLAAVAQAMGKPLRGVLAAEEELRELLKDVRLVLVLDNAEHLVEAVAGLVLLVAEFAQVKVLVTSRVRLNIALEQTLELGGLELGSQTTESPAISLLFFAVRKARPGFVWTPYEAEVASRICRVLDGVPLALELAGAWAKVFSLSEIARHIEEKLDFLEGSLDTPERHRGLRVVFTHSWQLLSGSERQALCRLALFEGGFEVGAGLEVAQVGHQDLLSLVNKSMLKIMGESYRRGEVHPLIGEYAHEKIRPSEHEQTLNRHAEYFLGFAETAAAKLRGPDQIEWMERLQLEHPNVRLALAWWTAQEGKAEGALKLATAMHWFWNVRGHYREGLEWLDKALSLMDAGQYPDQQAEALRCAGALCTDLGEYARAKAFLVQALDLWQQLGQSSGIARTQHQLGLLARDQNDPELAREYLEQSIAAHRRLGNTDWLAASLNDLAIVFAHNQELPKARAHFEESRSLKEAIGDKLGMAYAYNNLAVIADMEKRPFQETLPLYQKSLDIKRQLGDQMGVASTLNNLGELAWENQDPTARSYLSEALTMFQKIGHRSRTAQNLATFTQLLAGEGHLEKAAILVGFLKALTEKSGFALNPLQQKTMEGLEEKLEQTLGAERLALALASGQILSLEQAIQLAQTP